MSWLVGRELKRIQGRYEAAYWNLVRSYVPGFIQSAREDISALARQEIFRRTRYFEKNSTTAGKVLQVLDSNVIGAGITPSPAGPNLAWNTAALDWWNTWVSTADLTGTSSLYELQSQGYRAQNVDGDCGVRLTLSPVGRPALEMVESHRIGSIGVNVTDVDSGNFKYVDGIVVNRTTKAPSAYIVSDDFETGNAQTIPASQFVLFFKKWRPGQYRGITLFHAAILDLHDLDDIQGFEKQAAKEAAAISKIVESAAGAAMPDEALGASLSTPIAPDPNGRQGYYRQVLGNETIYTRPGDKITQFQSSRPSAAMTGFWDKLEEKIVRGGEISYAALLDYNGNWGGATLRAAMQADNKVFRLNTNHQANRWQKIWEYGIGWAMEHGELAKNPAWNKVRWHPPRRASVDVGNESQAMLDELKAGLRTYESVYGEIGDDWRERLEQRAQEEAFIQQLAKKYGIDRQYIASFAQERLAGQAPDAVGPGTPTPNDSPQKPGNSAAKK